VEAWETEVIEVAWDILLIVWVDDSEDVEARLLVLLSE
jgi:hypothetical protein